MNNVINTYPHVLSMVQNAYQNKIVTSIPHQPYVQSLMV